MIINRIKLSIIAVSLCIPFGALASDQADPGGKLETKCTHAKMVRRVLVRYLSYPSKAPCQVEYMKDTESPGEIQLLWRADIEPAPDYCQKKASGLVEKLRSWGWKCEDSEMNAKS